LKVAFVCANEEHIGVECLSAYLKQNGHETCLLFDPLLFAGAAFRIGFASRACDFTEYLVEKCRRESPDLLAFSVITDQYRWGLDLAARLKGQFGIPIVFGGIHPTFVPEYVIRNEVVDFVVVGEGEEALLELVEGLQSGRIDASMPNLWTMQNGRAVGNPPRDLIEDLDSLPYPDKELFYREVRGIATYTIMVSRGCPRNCTYCHNNTLRRIYNGRGKYLRYRSVDNVLAELIRAKTYGKRSVVFDDDSFAASVGWLREFAPRYAKVIGLPCFCWLHPSSATDEVLELLTLMNCQCVEMGIQSLNPGVRQRYLHRNGDNDQIKHAITRLKRAGISLIADHIWVLPGENFQDCAEAMEFYNRHRPTKLSVFYLRHYPGLEINHLAGLDESRLEEIRRGNGSRPFTLDGDYATRRLRQLETVATLLQLLPPFVVGNILRWRLYRYFPAVKLNLLSLFLFVAKHILSGKWTVGSMILRMPFRQFHSLKKLLLFKLGTRL